MFDKWLLFFYSNQTSINKFRIKKEFLEDGKMKMSGKEPEEWSIILKPDISKSIYDVIYEKENLKKESISLIKIGLINKDKKLFDEGISLYEKSLKDIEKLNKEFDKNRNVINKIEDEIFELKRKMYYEKDINKTLSMSEKVVELQNKKLSIIEEHNNNLDNFKISEKALVKKGPVPEPPTLKTETYKVIKKKFKFNTNTSSSTDTLNSLTNKKKDSDDYKKGGFIKVIKL